MENLNGIGIQMWNWFVAIDNPAIIFIIALIVWILIQFTKKVPYFANELIGRVKRKRKWMLPYIAVILGTILGLALIGLDIVSGVRGFLAGALAVWGVESIKGILKRIEN